MDTGTEKIPEQQGAAAPRQRAGILRNYGIGALSAVLIVLSFFGGAFFQSRHQSAAPQQQCGEQKPGQVENQGAPPPFALKNVDFNGFWDIWRTVHERYVHQPVSDVQMYYGSVAGMVASLGDPYSVFFDPDTAKKFSQELSGTFEGIGAELGIKKDKLTVIAPLPGTPAEKAGLKPGDWIVGIDGADTSGMLLDDAVSRIRGPKGTSVKLTVLHEGTRDPVELTIARATIVVQSVKWKMVSREGKLIAVITLSHFNEDTEARFNEAVRSVLLENPSGVVLDMRNNPGGFLDTAVKVAGEWVPHDVIVEEKFSDGTKKDYNSDGNYRFADLPTVVLVNGGSASASEIVAGALKDHGKAKIVGEQTYGKGSVQDYSELADGSALKLTVALWYTPKGTSIDKNGITPDEVVKLSDEDYNNDRDPQMDRALELLAPGAAAASAPAPTAPAKP